MHKIAAAALCLLALLPLSASAADWPTYHGDNTRQGYDGSDPLLRSAHPQWTSASLDGRLYGQPVIVGSQVIVATGNDTVYSLSAVTGAVQWSRNLGAPRTSNFPCGNINPLGITGTPVIDGGYIYVMAEVQQNPTTFVFDLVKLDMSGNVIWTQNMNPPDTHWDANVEQERGALLAVNGRIFVPLGGMYGDCGNYHGYVLSFPESGSGSLQWWASTETVAGGTEGGIWAAGGLSADAGGNVYAATGNGSQTSSGLPYDYSDGVIKLSSSAMSAGAPLDYFAPSTWYSDNAGDTDLGSTTPLQLPNNRIFIVGKSGMGYLLDSTNLGHIGGQLAAHQVCHGTADAAFGSLAYANGVAYVGCSDGTAAVNISLNDFASSWYNTSANADRPPSLAGGLVWNVSSGGSNLYGFDAGTGQLIDNLALPNGSTHFTTTSAANGQLFISSGSQVVAFGECGGTPVVGDFNGDGYADVADAGAGGECVATSTGSSFKSPATWSATAFYGNLATFAGNLTGTSGSPDDLIAVNDSSVWVMLSNKSGFNSPQEWSAVPFYGNRQTMVGSVAGSGRADLVALNSGSVWVMQATGAGYGSPQEWSAVPFYGTRATLLADVNGDGKMDLVAINDESVWVMTSTGGGFSSPQEWSAVPFYGDRQTIAGQVTAGSAWSLIAINSGSVWVAKASGTSFAAPQEWSALPFYGTQVTTVADVDKDNVGDLVALNNGSAWVEKSSGGGFGSPQEWAGSFP